MVYFSVVKCPCLRDHPLNKSTSVVFDSKEIGDLKPMTTDFFFFKNIHLCIYKKDKFPKRNTTQGMRHTLTGSLIGDLSQLQLGLRNKC